MVIKKQWVILDLKIIYNGREWNTTHELNVSFVYFRGVKINFRFVKLILISLSVSEYNNFIFIIDFNM